MSFIVESWKLEVNISRGHSAPTLLLEENGVDIDLVDPLRDICICCTAQRRYSITSKVAATTPTLERCGWKICMALMALRNMGWKEVSEQ